LSYWGYIVTFTKVLAIYHNWIHPLHYSLYPLLPPVLWKFKGMSSYIQNKKTGGWKEEWNWPCSLGMAKEITRNMKQFSSCGLITITCQALCYNLGEVREEKKCLPWGQLLITGRTWWGSYEWAIPYFWCRLWNCSSIIHSQLISSGSLLIPV
jgi:hypothetical protein